MRKEGKCFHRSHTSFSQSCLVSIAILPVVARKCGERELSHIFTTVFITNNIQPSNARSPNVKLSLSAITTTSLPTSTRNTAEMARSEEAQAFFHAVYSAVQEIPHGKVTSYGHIAKLIGTRTCSSATVQPHRSRYRRTSVLCRTRSACNADADDHLVTAQRPRQVGVCLKHLPVDPSARFNHENVPWQRVINAKGVISPRYVQL